MYKIKLRSLFTKTRVRSSLIKLYQSIRILKYRFFSEISFQKSTAYISQPVLLIGAGKISLGKCNLGVWPSPYYLNGYIHIEAREATASIEINHGVWINNNAVIISERSHIYIGANTLIGSEFTVFDSDFHDLHPERRQAGSHKCKPVFIGENVFIGARVTILKGVEIGNNAVIAAGSVVSSNVPENAIAAGVPARIVSYVNCKD